MRVLFCLFFFSILYPMNVIAESLLYESPDGNLVLYKIDASKPCLARKNLKVYQANGKVALVCEVGNFSCERYGEKLMYLVDEHHYYDGEIIPNPEGKCAKQVGVYRYETVAKYEDGSHIYKTVPVISILNK